VSGMGVIEGGWEFVWAAYLVSAIVIFGYGGSLLLRLRAENARAEREEKQAKGVAP
jgi:hypothetical protein